MSYVWLVTFALAAILALSGFACQMLRVGRTTRTSYLIWTTLSSLVGILCVVAICEHLDGWLTPTISLFAKTGLIATAGLAGYGLMVLRWASPATVHGSWRLSWGLLATNGLAAVFASGSFYQAVAPVDEPLSIGARATADWVKIEGANAYTDSGRPVSLRRLECSGDAPGSSGAPEAFPRRAIQVAPSDQRANCHGWVFAAGRFAISGSDVDTILSDNQYDLVEHPRPGDLIVFRDAAGEVLHSGVVRTADQDLILIESKWGALARYVHQPRDQGYTTNYQFYRSPRAGHTLHWESEDSGHADSGRALDVKSVSPPKHEYVILKNSAATATKESFGLPTLGQLPPPLGRRS